MLQSQGFENVAQNFVARLQERARRHLSPLTKLAIVCGYEHYTAILGNYLLSNPQVLRVAQPNMALIWGWHAAEETEHKAVCFDLYRAAGGGWRIRVSTFLWATFNFGLIFGRVYLHMLWRDGSLNRARILTTIPQSIRFFFGRSGVAWHLVYHGLRYLSPNFHPWNQNNRGKLQDWLSSHLSQLREISERQER